MNTKKYVVVANRDRDAYQVPIAFAETGQLAGLVTDYYHGAWPFAIPGLAHRFTPEIPPELVATSLKAVLVQVAFLARRRFQKSTTFPSIEVDDALAKRTSQIVEKSGADGIVSYSGYAFDSFTRFPDRHRVLFQFHPPRSIIEQALASDDLADARPWLPEPETVDDRISDLYSIEIANADRIICLCQFARAGLELDGVDRSNIRIVPHGCPPLPQGEPVPLFKQRRFLFVGQGVQRKGLHLLVKAWNAIDTKGFSLRVIASRIDPEILSMIRESRHPIEYSSGVSQEELQGEFEKSDTLLLPSLVEGFGLVLGEALSAGCRLIATTNTGLPDMALPSSIATVVEAGSIKALAEALQRHMDTHVETIEHAMLAQSEAKLRSRAEFRAGIRDSVR